MSNIFYGDLDNKEKEKTDRKWHKPCESLPDSDVVVDVILGNGEESELRYHSNLWWLPDNSMYAYYPPELWRYKNDE